MGQVEASVFRAVETRMPRASATRPLTMPLLLPRREEPDPQYTFLHIFVFDVERRPRALFERGGSSFTTLRTGFQDARTQARYAKRRPTVLARLRAKEPPPTNECFDRTLVNCLLQTRTTSLHIRRSIRRSTKLA